MARDSTWVVIIEKGELMRRSLSARLDFYASPDSYISIVMTWTIEVLNICPGCSLGSKHVSGARPSKEKRHLVHGEALRVPQSGECVQRFAVYFRGHQFTIYQLQTSKKV